MRAAAIGYIEFVASRALQYSQLSANFVALGLGSAIASAGLSKKPAIRTALVEQLTFGLTQSARISAHDAVVTRSNLSMDAFQDICDLLGVDGRNYLTKRQLLDKRLLVNRNLAAHGRRVNVDEKDYKELHEEVIEMVDNFKFDLENAVDNESFRL